MAESSGTKVQAVFNRPVSLPTGEPNRLEARKVVVEVKIHHDAPLGWDGALMLRTQDGAWASRRPTLAEEGCDDAPGEPSTLGDDWRKFTFDPLVADDETPLRLIVLARRQAPLKTS